MLVLTRIDILDVTKPSHPLAQQQMDAVDKVLQELDVGLIPKLVVWNKVKNVITWSYISGVFIM